MPPASSDSPDASPSPSSSSPSPSSSSSSKPSTSSPSAPSFPSAGPGSHFQPGKHPNPPPSLPLASEVVLHPISYALHHSAPHPRPPIPEKCLTWCSQRSDAPPLCRMFCLRRQKPQATQAEQLARLRPVSLPLNPAATLASASAATADPGPGAAGAAGGRGGAGGETASWWDKWSGWSPFDALRKRVEPYSIILIRGTPDGVVGRYMEELEFDDGQYDFGAISRGAIELQKRQRGEQKFEFYDWEDHGSLMYIPLTSLLSPILSLPERTARILNPPLAFLGRYRTSFTDGSQVRNAEKLWTEIQRGAALDLLARVGRQVEQTSKRIEEERTKQFEEMRKLKEAEQQGRKTGGQ